MRQLGILESEKHAQHLRAWLLAEGIDVHVDPEGGKFEFWVRNEDQLPRAREEWKRFLEQPDDPRYQQARGRALELEREQARRQQQYQRNRQRPGSAKGVTRSTPLTMLLIATSALVALLTNFGEEGTQTVKYPAYQAMAFTSVKGTPAQDLVQQYGEDGDALAFRLASIRRGEVWRVVTPMFIHFGTIHLIFNMIWLWQLGRTIEIRYGTFWLGVIVLATATLSNLAQACVPERLAGSPPEWISGQVISLFGGMSGVVYGLFGFIWIKAAFDPSSRMFLPTPTIVVMVVWLLLCMTPAVSYLSPSGHVANWAHGVGILTGMLCAWLSMQPVFRARRRTDPAG